MEAKNKLNELKESIFSSLSTWADERIDDFVADKPKLKVASVYMKRGAHNYLSKEQDRIGGMIDSAALFICDEQGNVDAEMLFDDLLTMFREMDEMPFSKGFLRGSVGKGVIRFELPDNPMFGLLFGNTGAIKITEADLFELKEMFVAEGVSSVSAVQPLSAALK